MADKSFGVAFEWDNGTAQFTITQLTRVGEFASTLETIDVTTHDGNGYRKHASTLYQLQPITIEGLFDPDEGGTGVTHAELRNKADAGSIVGTITATDPDASVANCVITEFTVGEQTVDGLLSFRATFAPTGSGLSY